MESLFVMYLDSLITEIGILLVVGCFVVGVIIKRSLDFVPNKYIPLICAGFGVLVTIFIPDLFSGSPEGVRWLQGMICGWAATGGYEMIKAK